jgi:RimJ/RimL family protein N-acetyltransferase
VGAPRLETERLVLRAWHDDDLDAYARICADPEVMRYIGDGSTLSREDAWRSMAMFTGHWVLRGFGTWAVEERATGAMVGRIGLHHPTGWPGLEVGWALDQSVWGRGYATEGGAAALDHAWRDLGAERVISLIAPDNARSIAVAHRLGERFERTIDLRGRDVRIYGIDRPPSTTD